MGWKLFLLVGVNLFLLIPIGLLILENIEQKLDIKRVGIDLPATIYQLGE